MGNRIKSKTLLSLIDKSKILIPLVGIALSSCMPINNLRSYSKPKLYNNEEVKHTKYSGKLKIFTNDKDNDGNPETSYHYYNGILKRTYYDYDSDGIPDILINKHGTIIDLKNSAMRQKEKEDSTNRVIRGARFEEKYYADQKKDSN